MSNFVNYKLGVGDVAQAVECLPTTHKALGLIRHRTAQVLVHTCNAATREEEV